MKSISITAGLKRRQLLAGIAAIAGAALIGRTPAEAAPNTTMAVWKDRYCSCCSAWIERLGGLGLAISVTDSDDMAAVKNRLGVPSGLYSCHTASIDKYVLEGHVPPEAIRRLLDERPMIAGLAVAGMPIGSPGMEAQSQTQNETYDVVAFGPAGQSPYMRFRGATPA
ncbi:MULTISPECIES: DUF411 domain-containing protein [Pannonibacter]|jgi:hypothetical protein|uniref:DUF411 domain-containing protein n=1 Tax=Pannonibacter TaxID=227873 RepID=UPI000D0F9016|nr:MULTISPECIES: DUF411 domain-containing protein [Pannonibacter]MBN9491055.1 DUF411 domain-containing protein [Alphaproteobacteria bacterium]